MLAAAAIPACVDGPTAPRTGPAAPGDPVTPGNPVTPAPSPVPAPAGGYNVTVRYVGGEATARQKQAVANAVAAWQTAITGDLPDIPASAAANACFSGQPALSETVDDILVYIEFQTIDGPGKILGQAGPCFIRNEGSLPVVGQLRLDQADLQTMEQNGTLDAVVLHEMGHILGIGTLWSTRQVLSGAGGADPRFTGLYAIDAYHILGGLDATVPVENTGEVGTRDGHWCEAIFGNELMTGYIGRGLNPMSALTIASLRDMGYNANSAAAGTYSLATARSGTYAVVDMHTGEYLMTPQFLINRNGETARIAGTTSADPWRTKQ
jgi:hypothetical protein